MSKMEIRSKVRQGVLCGLIDKTYLIENLYKKNDFQNGNFILNSLREGLKELQKDILEENSSLNSINKIVDPTL